MDVRDRIAAALAGIPRMNPQPHRPVTPTAGQVWPEWVSTEYERGTSCGSGATSTWQVWLCIDPLSVGTLPDADRDKIGDLLAAVGRVESCEPGSVDIATDSRMQQPCIVYTLTTTP